MQIYSKDVIRSKYILYFKEKYYERYGSEEQEVYIKDTEFVERSNVVKKNRKVDTRTRLYNFVNIY